MERILKKTIFAVLLLTFTFHASSGLVGQVKDRNKSFAQFSVIISDEKGLLNYTFGFIDNTLNDGSEIHANIKFPSHIYLDLFNSDKEFSETFANNIFTAKQEGDIRVIEIVSLAYDNSGFPAQKFISTFKLKPIQDFIRFQYTDVTIEVFNFVREPTITSPLIKNPQPNPKQFKLYTRYSFGQKFYDTGICIYGDDKDDKLGATVSVEPLNRAVFYKERDLYDGIAETDCRDLVKLITE